MTLSFRLKELRFKKNLTQAEVARKLGVTQQSYARWENGRVTPSLEKLTIISNFYEVSTDFLLSNPNNDFELLTIEKSFRQIFENLSDEDKKVFREKIIEFINEWK